MDRFRTLEMPSRDPSPDASNVPAAATPGLTFEQALAELEALVARMEDGKLPLEESLAAYQRGAELIRHCESKLTDAQARIAILDGETLREFDPGTK
jgi:exodeoxyribonuclease VII small subunit